MKHLICIITLSLVLFAGQQAQAQDVAVKTNLLYGVYTYTPNLGLEIGLGKRTTLDISGGYNPWNLKGSADNNKKAVHWLVEPEFRYWLCERFNGHFFGIHALGSQFNIAQHNLPMLLGKGSDKYRYEGWAVGAGVSYGYQLLLGKRWSVEFTLGVGYAQLNYDKYDCPKCGEKIESGKTKNYFGPTKAGISLIFIIK